MKKSKFTANYASQSESSNNYLSVQTLIMQQCEFKDNNQFDYSLISKFLAWPFESEFIMEEVLKDQFTSNSKGGSVYIMATEIQITMS